MTKYLMIVSYDGSKYYGFQRLKNHPSVQEELEKSLKKVFKEDVLIKGAGRTDKGVHANGQGISFDAPFKLDVKDLLKGVNRYLPMDIRVKSCTEKESDFHARFSVKKKVYEYKINVGDFNPLYINYYYQPKEKIDIRKLRQSSKVFIGLHDFKNFVSGDHKNTISKILNISVKKRNNIIVIKITGTNFYKYMVRNIIGAMLDYNKNKVDLEYIKNMLNNPEKKLQLTTTCPQGLYLEKIYY